MKKLESKDVMLGDWILVDKNAWVDDEYDSRCGVEKYEPYFIETSEDIDDVDWYDSPAYGVPLTDEILRKNGFDYYHKNFASLSPEHPFKLEMVEWEEKYGNGGLWKFGDLIEIRYVHELQHLLKLMNIDKEIELL